MPFQSRKATFGRNDPASSGVNWVNPGNVAGTSSSATCTIPTQQSTKHLGGSQFGFGIPAGASLTGFTWQFRSQNGQNAPGQFSGECGGIGATGAQWVDNNTIQFNSGSGGLTPAQVNDGAFEAKMWILNPQTVSTIQAIFNDCECIVFYNELTTTTPTYCNITGGNNQTTDIGAAFGSPLQVTILDQNSTPMAGTNVIFELPGSGPSGTFSGGSTIVNVVTNGSGVATSPGFTANGAGGTWYPQAYSQQVPSIGASFTMTNVVPSTITTLQAYGGNNQQAEVSTQYGSPLQARMLDQNGTPMAGQQVVWSVPGTGAAGSFAGGTPNNAVTNGSGIATSGALTANSQAGSWQCLVQAVSALGVSATYDLTNYAAQNPSVPSSFGSRTGGGQLAAFGTPFAQPITAILLDQYGVPMVNTSVRFTLPAGYATFPGSVQTADALTDAAGKATSPTITAGTVAGTFAVTLTSGAATTTVLLQNVDPTVANSIDYISGGGQDTAVNQPFGASLIVRATNGLGAPIDGVLVAFTAPGAGASCTFDGELVDYKFSGSLDDVFFVDPITGPPGSQLTASPNWATRGGTQEMLYTPAGTAVSGTQNASTQSFAFLVNPAPTDDYYAIAQVNLSDVSATDQGALSIRYDTALNRYAMMRVALNVSTLYLNIWNGSALLAGATLVLDPKYLTPTVHTFKIQGTGPLAAQNFKVWIDGDLLIDYTDITGVLSTRGNAGLRSGRVGAPLGFQWQNFAVATPLPPAGALPGEAKSTIPNANGTAGTYQVTAEASGVNVVTFALTNGPPDIAEGSKPLLFSNM